MSLWGKNTCLGFGEKLQTLPFVSSSGNAILFLAISMSKARDCTPTNVVASATSVSAAYVNYIMWAFSTFSL